MVPPSTHLRRHRRGWLWLAAIAMAAVTACWLLAELTDLIAPAAPGAAVLAERTHPAVLLAVSEAVSGLAGPAVAIGTVAALAWLAFARHGPRAAILVGAAAAVVVVTTIAKHLPGPRVTLPSGHAAYAASVGGIAAWMALRAGRRRAAAVIVALGLLMACARVVEGEHTWLDVATGLVLGAAWLVVVLVVGGTWATERRTVDA